MGNYYNVRCTECRYTDSYLDGIIAGPYTPPRVCPSCRRITTSLLPNSSLPEQFKQGRPRRDQKPPEEIRFVESIGCCTVCGDPAPRLENGSPCPRCPSGELQVDHQEGMIVD